MTDIFNVFFAARTQVMSLDVRAHEVEVRLGTISQDEKTGEQKLIPQEPFTVQSVLVSVGRVPNTDKLNLKVSFATEWGAFWRSLLVHTDGVDGAVGRFRRCRLRCRVCFVCRWAAFPKRTN